MPIYLSTAMHFSSLALSLDCHVKIREISKNEFYDISYCHLLPTPHIQLHPHNISALLSDKGRSFKDPHVQQAQVWLVNGLKGDLCLLWI